jgi:hypothetical protein
MFYNLATYFLFFHNWMQMTYAKGVDINVK